VVQSRGQVAWPQDECAAPVCALSTAEGARLQAWHAQWDSFVGEKTAAAASLADRIDQFLKGGGGGGGGGGGAVGGGSAGAAVAEKLGHLPLALAIAAAYMRACDVPCSAYLRKLSSTRAAPRLDGAAGEMTSYATGVSESFSLSLAQVDRDAAATSGKDVGSPTPTLASE